MIVSRAETSGHCFREDAGTKNPNSSAVNPQQQQQIGKTNEFFIIYGDKNYPHINWNDLTINEKGTSQEDFYCKELDTQV